MKRFVSLRHLRFTDLKQLEETMARIVTDRTWDGVDVDYLDGTVFTATEAYLTLGAQTTSRARSATTPTWPSTTGPSSTNRSTTPRPTG